MRRTPKENINQSFINLIRKAHGLIENSDIEKHRHSQDQMGALFGNSREVAVTETTVGSMYAEWIRVDQPAFRKENYFVLSWRRLQYRKSVVCQNPYHEACKPALHGCVLL